MFESGSNQLNVAVTLMLPTGTWIEQESPVFPDGQFVQLVNVWFVVGAAVSTIVSPTVNCAPHTVGHVIPAGGGDVEQEQLPGEWLEDRFEHGCRCDVAEPGRRGACVRKGTGRVKASSKTPTVKAVERRMACARRRCSVGLRVM